MQCCVVKTPAVHCHSDVYRTAGGHSAGCRMSWVCLQHRAMWWQLLVFQYVAASLHLPSGSTANINTVQYTIPWKQCDSPTNTAVVISKVLLPQSNITAVFFHSNSSLLSGVSSCLPKYNHNIKILNLCSVWHFLLNTSHSCSKCPTTNIQLIFQCHTALCW